MTLAYIKPFLSNQYGLIILTAFLITTFYNVTFFREVEQVFSIANGKLLFIASLYLLLFLLHVLLFSLFASRITTKLLLIMLIMIATVSEYVVATYGVVIDIEMLRNTLQSDYREAMGLFSMKFIYFALMFSAIPIIVIIRWPLHYRSFFHETLTRCIVVFVSLSLSLMTIWLFSADFSSLVREYKALRYRINPDYPIYAAFSLGHQMITSNSASTKIEKIAEDAEIVHPDDDKKKGRPHRELIIMVVGETARADHFSLNGYPRDVNPRLSQIENLISFTNVFSCGTSTAVSVPCMFSHKSRREYRHNSIDSYENALDILKRKGVNILWRDNNSSSKGVANRVEFQDFRSPNLNPVCDTECRDDGMLYGLEKYIDSHQQGDILIVLHQMGSHGPEYFKRYPAEFEYFTPVCKSKILGDCTSEEIINAYDNTIRYTDFFLSRVIDLLKQYDSKFEAGMYYISDHGESLGENGIYLHGLPYTFAPENQKHVASILWAGTYFDFQLNNLKDKKTALFTHDSVFCMLLGLFEVDAKLCPKSNIDQPFGLKHHK